MFLDSFFILHPIFCPNMSTPNMCSTIRGQKRAKGSLEMEF